MAKKNKKNTDSPAVEINISGEMCELSREMVIAFYELHRPRGSSAAPFEEFHDLYYTPDGDGYNPTRDPQGGTIEAKFAPDRVDGIVHVPLGEEYPVRELTDASFENITGHSFPDEPECQTRADTAYENARNDLIQAAFISNPGCIPHDENYAQLLSHEQQERARSAFDRAITTLVEETVTGLQATGHIPADFHFEETRGFYNSGVPPHGMSDELKARMWADQAGIDLSWQGQTDWGSSPTGGSKGGPSRRTR